MALQAAKVKTPTSAISPDSMRGPCCAPCGLRQQGFTLIELLVVMAVGAMLVALVPPAFERLREVSQYRDTVRAMVVDLRQARQQAIAYGKVVVFRVDLADRQFGIDGRAQKALPSALQVKTTVAKDEPANQAQQSTIAFMPEGGSTGGTIELVRPSGAGVNIRVDWLLGQISQEPRTP